MSRNRRAAARWAACAILLQLSTGTVAAQELGVMGVWGTSTNVEIPDPRGFGAFAQLDFAGVGFRLSLTRFSDDTLKPGVVCRVYSPRIDCVTEEVDTAVRMSSARVDVLKLIPLGPRFRIEAGGGLSFNSLSLTATGDSGRPADTSAPNTGQIGGMATAALAVSPLPEIPVTLRATYSAHWVRFGDCADPDEPTAGYAPFCGTDRIGEIQVGASFTIPRR